MRPTTILFTEKEPHIALQLAKKLRDGTMHVHLCMASPYINQAETNDKVLIMPDVSHVCRLAIRDVYPHAVDVKPEPLPPIEEPTDHNVIALPVIPIKRPRGRPRKYPVAVE